MIDRQAVSLRKLSDKRSEAKKFERWINNKQVTTEKLIYTEQARLKPIVKNRHVLAIQDTSEINHRNHAGRVKGLGTVGNGKDVGFFIHPMLVLDAKTQACLGTAAIHLENRLKKVTKRRKNLPIEEKESYRWVSTAEISKQVLSEASCITFIGDRENDIYTFLNRIPDEKTQILVRLIHDRELENGAKLLSYLEQEKEKGRLTVKIPREIRVNRKEREATLSIKYSDIVIRKPLHSKNKEDSETIKLRVVEAREIDCPDDQKPVHWLLLTTHEVKTIEDAKQMLDWYRARWNVEQVFRMLKRQGLDVESSQIETAEGLMKLVIVALCAAIQILQLVSSREGSTDQKTSDIFTSEEENVLAKLLPRLEGKTEKQKNPYPRENLAWAAWIIARLGGWHCEKAHRPGPGTMKWGLQRFQGIFDGWKLFINLGAE